eukprot:TRINITY_DN622_c0_g1_i17.p1 TRINITY_DN622_c0_g1~~TRINITY_DN622_c0_g1_i17.p1  ORF type:complete len:104 (+),score=16.98 TRINITY_DN622_c0_g1_i17:175-486(+)
MIRRPPRSTLSSSSAASDVYKRQFLHPTSNKSMLIHYWCLKFCKPRHTSAPSDGVWSLHVEDDLDTIVDDDHEGTANTAEHLGDEALVPVSYTHLTLPTKRIV